MSLKLEAIFGEGVTCWLSLWRPSRCIFPLSTSPWIFLPTFPKLPVFLSFLSLSILFVSSGLCGFPSVTLPVSFLRSCSQLPSSFNCSVPLLLSSPGKFVSLSFFYLLLVLIFFPSILLSLACHQAGLFGISRNGQTKRQTQREREKGDLTYIYMYNYLLFKRGVRNTILL